MILRVVFLTIQDWWPSLVASENQHRYNDLIVSPSPHHSLSNLQTIISGLQLTVWMSLPKLHYCSQLYAVFFGLMLNFVDT
jgi:hypothetical protein